MTITVDYCAWDGCRGHSGVLTYTNSLTGAILLAGISNVSSNTIKLKSLYSQHV